MSKKPNRTWHMVVSLGIPLSIVGISAMAISYATLIDVARVNGLPLPELFPILVDVGTVACMIAAAQFRIRGMDGRWLAYVTFTMLSGVSIVANATHAWRAADMAITTPWAAGILAATPPAALLAITHLVMMLIPDEKERARLVTQRERVEQPSSGVRRAPTRKPAKQTTAAATDAAQLRLVKPAHSTPTRVTADQQEIRQQVIEQYRISGVKPTGAAVGEWLGGKSAKTGQRFLTSLEEAGDFDQVLTSSMASGG